MKLKYAAPIEPKSKNMNEAIQKDAAQHNLAMPLMQRGSDFAVILAQEVEMIKAALSS